MVRELAPKWGWLSEPLPALVLVYLKLFGYTTAFLLLVRIGKQFRQAGFLHLPRFGRDFPLSPFISAPVRWPDMV